MDGFFIHSTSKKFIRESLSVKDFCLPSSDSSIINLNHSENDHIQKEIKAEIETKVKVNTRLSVTMDEYTLVHYRRYMNINVHCQNDVINLGVMTMLESYGAEKILQLLEKQLADFGITKMQISVVSIVSGGASGMKKLFKISLLCTWCASGCVDVLFKNRSVTYIAGEDYNYDDDQDEEMYEEGFGIVIPATASNEIPLFNVDIKKVLKKVRKVVKIFQRSPVKNEVLQKYVLLVQNKELILVLDCKTRWSSMFEMVKWFIRLKKRISKDLFDLSIEHDISSAEFLFFEPIKLAIDALWGKDARF